MSTCCASDKIFKVLTEIFPQKLGDVLRIFHMTTPFNSHRLCPHFPTPLFIFTIIQNRENYPGLTRLTKSHLLPAQLTRILSEPQQRRLVTGGWLL